MSPAINSKKIIFIILGFTAVFLIILTGIIKNFYKSNPAASKNHTTPLVSPGGRYTLTMPIITAEKNGYKKWWQVTIADNTISEPENNGGIIYADAEDFPARFNVYWVWDNNDRVWLYNSDDGQIYYWEMKNNQWTKNIYQRANADLTIPSDLLPKYAK